MKKKLIEVAPIKEKIDKLKTKKKQEKKKKIEKKLEDIKMGVEEKIKKRQKLTTEDLLAFQQDGK